MKRGLLALGLASLAIALALVASSHLPRWARPVLLGVIAGAVASLPTSLFIVWRLARRAGRARPTMTSQPAGPMAIIVVPPSTLAGPVPQKRLAKTARSPAEPRHKPRPLKIIGGQGES